MITITLTGNITTNTIVHNPEAGSYRCLVEMRQAKRDRDSETERKREREREREIKKERERERER